MLRVICPRPSHQVRSGCAAAICSCSIAARTSAIRHPRRNSLSTCRGKSPGRLITASLASASDILAPALGRGLAFLARWPGLALRRRLGLGLRWRGRLETEQRALAIFARAYEDVRPVDRHQLGFFFLSFYFLRFLSHLFLPP